MKKHAKRFVLMGKIPFSPKFFKKSYASLTKEQQLESDGWVKSGGGYADALLSIGVYISYFRDELHDVEKLAAKPHYPSFSSSPDYWMYGKMIKRKYVYYYVQEDRIEDRGISFHATVGTKTFRQDELKWIGDEDLYVASWACN